MELHYVIFVYPIANGNLTMYRSEKCSYPKCDFSKDCVWYVANEVAYHPNCVFIEIECCADYIKKEAI